VLAKSESVRVGVPVKVSVVFMAFMVGIQPFVSAQLNYIRAENGPIKYKLSVSSTYLFYSSRVRLP